MSIQCMLNMRPGHPNPNYSRTGKRWTQSEHNIFLQAHMAGVSSEELARRHLRHPGAIYQKLIEFGWVMKDQVLLGYLVSPNDRVWLAERLPEWLSHEHRPDSEWRLANVDARLLDVDTIDELHWLAYVNAPAFDDFMEHDRVVELLFQNETPGSPDEVELQSVLHERRPAHSLRESLAYSYSLGFRDQLCDATPLSAWWNRFWIWNDERNASHQRQIEKDFEKNERRG